MLIAALLALLAGCASYGNRQEGADLGSMGTGAPGKGTTGVSTGADTGPFVTGSDAAPRR